MKNNKLELQIPGERLRSLIVTRVGALEGEAFEAKKNEDALLAAGGARRCCNEESKTLRVRANQLALVRDLIDSSVTYTVTLTDLAMLDLLDVFTGR